MSKQNVICKFRFHRSTLEESMATCVEVHSKKELCEVIKQELGKIFAKKIQPRKIKFKEYPLDNRIDWKEQYLVSVNRLGVIGFSDSELK